MALGNLVMDETGSVTGVRVLSHDASGTKMEICVQLSGTIRGVAETTLWTYNTLTRPDGSIFGEGLGLMTTGEGDVITLKGHGSAKAVGAGEKTKFRTMLHTHSASAKYADLNSIGLAGEYDVDPSGSATNKNWEWK
jgi:hypothetical protein